MNVLRYAANGVFAMTTRTHRFKIGQTVSLIPSISRTAAPASLKLLGCTRLRAKRQGIGSNRRELHERIVADTGLIPSAL
jgi:hypothetical protein